VDASPSRAQENALPGQQSAVDKLMGDFDNPLLRHREDQIRKSLVDSKITDQNEREKVLVRHLAVSQIARSFDRVYWLIFGSQIRALMHLNTHAMDRLQDGVMKNLYDQAAAKYSDFYATYAFEQWIEFLEREGLLEKNDGNVRITLVGREYLKYLVAQSYLLEKQG